jgi:putative peptidoglycan binding protein
MPRRRRRARAVAAEPEAERGLAMRILLHSPKDTIAGMLAFAAVSAIIANALFLQAGRHPSPMFGSVVTLPANPLPRPRPLEADAASGEPKLAEPRLAESRLAESRPAELKPVEKPADPLSNLVKTTGVAPASVLRPPALAAAGPRRVAAVQRALTEYGYGQLKPTGAVGADTQAAIQRFERERRLPVTGQVSDRLVRELAAVIGHPID